MKRCPGCNWWRNPADARVCEICERPFDEYRPSGVRRWLPPLLGVAVVVGMLGSGVWFVFNVAAPRSRAEPSATVPAAGASLALASGSDGLPVSTGTRPPLSAGAVPVTLSPPGPGTVAPVATSSPRASPTTSATTTPSVTPLPSATWTPSVSPSPSPTPPPPTPEIVRVANTEGVGVCVRGEPRVGPTNCLAAWPEETQFRIIGPDQRVGEEVWRQVEDPVGNRGWARADYLLPATPRPPTRTPPTE